ncbi:hypothetical protein PLICRDRAFT_180973 [Plicaturopsis crispa FD-325 SS-3]|uniref:Uncharacterized protein n=1 Tax=Plicaturopsis crispa FD-325 SS-3 TaxID=944288 RepID=A0A0C9SV66_PLICR|nr:hypothetical protein PLICRDRAFT_180973 [Plicaturopsis crispa FD-325 SS-3]
MSGCATRDAHSAQTTAAALCLGAMTYPAVAVPVPPHHARTLPPSRRTSALISLARPTSRPFVPSWLREQRWSAAVVRYGKRGARGVLARRPVVANRRGVSGACTGTEATWVCCYATSCVVRSRAPALCPRRHAAADEPRRGPSVAVVRRGWLSWRKRRARALGCRSEPVLALRAGAVARFAGVGTRTAVPQVGPWCCEHFSHPPDLD